MLSYSWDSFDSWGVEGRKYDQRKIENNSSCLVKIFKKERLEKMCSYRDTIFIFHRKERFLQDMDF